MKEKQKKKNEREDHVTLKGWISLIVLVFLFSGIFQNSDGPLAALDIMNLGGTFGEISDGLNFMGQNGTGANAGFLFALSLIPITALSMGILDVVEALGAMKAARKVFAPILKPIYGIPGSAGVAFIASFTSSDITAVMTKKLYDENEITDDERTKFISYQYAGSAVIGNVISTQAPLLPIVLLPMGALIGLLVVFKTFGCCLMRLWINRQNAKVNKNKDNINDNITENQKEVV